MISKFILLFFKIGYCVIYIFVFCLDFLIFVFMYLILLLFIEKNGKCVCMEILV